VSPRNANNAQLPFAAERLYKGGVAEQIAAQLVTRIVEDDLQPGSLLPTETDLATAFGVGKSAIREAVRIVATKGLIDVAHGSGMRVTPRERWKVIDPELVGLLGRGIVTMEHLIQVRHAIEPEIAAAAALHATPEDLDVLTRVTDQQTQAARQSNTDYVRLDIEFHDGLAAATRNPVYPILMNSLSDLLVVCRRAIIRSAPVRARGLMHHRRIMEAVAAGDSPAARMRMLAHLDQVESDWQRAVGSPNEPVLPAHSRVKMRPLRGSAQSGTPIVALHES
jgi:DNA-binding FadR family transcriptional regulator